MKNIRHTIRLTPLLFIASASALFVSCEKKGPAEKAGEAIDEKVEEVKDATE